MVSSHRSGKITSPHYPEPACGWMAENYNKETFVLVVDHVVDVDDYAREEIDPWFLNGRCAESVCSTVYENILWVSFKFFERVCRNTL